MVYPFQNIDSTHNNKNKCYYFRCCMPMPMPIHTEEQPHTFTMCKIGAPDSATIDALIICFVMVFTVVFCIKIWWHNRGKKRKEQSKVARQLEFSGFFLNGNTMPKSHKLNIFIIIHLYRLNIKLCGVVERNICSLFMLSHWN